ncbi:hypothetical protein QZH41_010529, partial [Actinostola sp. cb2023]
YGFIHCALADLVVSKFGEDVWRKIIAKAGVELGGGSYLIHKIYDDEETLSLIAAACEILGLELNPVLEVFGAHFLDYCIQSGYDRILRVLGRNLHDFLCNLDALHDHLQSIYPGMEAPSFRCTETDDGTLLLHYYSKRPGLSYIVIGLVKAIAHKLLDTEMTVEIRQDLDENNDHVTFAIREVEIKSPTTSKLGLQTFDFEGQATQDAAPLNTGKNEKRGDRDRMSLLSFCKAFPFHVMFDRKLQIKQTGLALMRLLKFKPQSTVMFTDIFDLARPRMEFSYEAVRSHINTVFIVTTKPGVITFPLVGDSTSEPEDAREALLRLKGQMLYIPESGCVIFLCSPRVANLDSFRRKSLFFSDIPIHDATRDLLFMSHARRAERELVEKLEETSNNLKKIESKLIDHKKKTDDLLHSILPKEVAAKLRLNQPVPAESYKVVTILFSDIVGFTALCSNDDVVPMDIVKLLNKLYTFFDMLSGMNDVYKVETIGDAYMVVGGLPHPCDNHADRVVSMGCSMMEATESVHSPVDKSPIKIRIGIHTGSVMAGVVGKKMPRYCLFGSTVTLANKMESGSQPGRINISIDTKKEQIGQIKQDTTKDNSSTTDDVTNSDTLFGDSLDFTREIINVISQVLEQNVEDLLRELGRATFLMFLQLPQGKIIQSLGSSLCDFLNNIDNFVDIVVQAQELNDAKPPSFRCELLNDGHSLELYYYSKRHGWESCVLGAVICAAEVLFHQKVTMTIKTGISNHSSDDMDYTVFEIRQECEYFAIKKSICSTDPHELVISVPTLCCAFPCHIVFDYNMEIQQLGVALLRLIGHSLIQHGTSMGTYFELIRPDINFTFKSILCRINGSFLLMLKPTSPADNKTLMELKGQMMHLPESNCILFLASPLVKKLEQLKGRGLFLSDIPIHDATRDLILVSEQAHAQDEIKKRMEQLQTELEKASNELEDEKKKTEDLLGSIFPQDVANKLINKQSVPARFIENVTMLFSDIVGFTSICGKCTAMEVVEMLEDLYTQFDKLCGELDLYKVETIGDAYVVAGGVQSLHGTVQDGHRVAKMALSMIDFLENVISPEGVPLKMRVGIHTGSVLSGVVGTKMPRYCLFGHDVTIANKMESESEAGRINISSTTYDYPKHCSMYGFINRALQKMVVRDYGFDVWKDILKKANVDLGDENEFNERRIYDDQNTTDVLTVAVDVLGVSKNFILEKFGTMFFEHCQLSGYDMMLQTLGGTMKEVFNGLDGLHEQMLLLYPGMHPPSFRAKESKYGRRLEIHYHSERIGLEFLVVGLVKAIANKLFGISVNVKVLSFIGTDNAWAKVLVLAQNDEDLKYIIPQDKTMALREKELSIITLGSRMSSITFCRACPFHVMFDHQMVIYQAGISVCRVLPGIKVGKSKFQDIFECVRPPIKLTFDNLLDFINKVYVVKTKEGLLDSSSLTTVTEDDFGKLESPSMRFRGQMLHLPECDSIVFLASPSVVNLDGLNEKGLYLSDIPIHDATRDLILLSEQHNAEFKLSQRLEMLADKLQQTSRELQSEQQLTDRLLYSILPASVANDLRLRKPIMANKYEIVTILFSGIVNFTSYCNQINEPMVIVELLNEVYIHFDNLTDNNDEVYKVETVGDKYMAVSGLPTKCEKHGSNIANLALDMINIVKGVNAKGMQQQLQVTIGIHSGEVVAGVVGQKKPRYCLFGNTVNLTSRTETTGLKGKINVSEYAYRCLLCQPNERFVFKRRGPVVMKGKKEPMITYILTEKNT